MKITHEDNKRLLEAVSLLNCLADTDNVEQHAEHLRCITHHCRKIWILIEQAQRQGNLNLQALCNEGVSANSSSSSAIRALCPLACKG